MGVVQRVPVFASPCLSRRADEVVLFEVVLISG